MRAPSPANSYQTAFVAGLVASFARATGGNLMAEAGLDPARLGQSAWEGRFALLTHDLSAILNYANRFTLDLWEMDWETMRRTPSRLTAPEEDRAERGHLMAAVARDGFVRNYTGRRVSRSGKLFLIQRATVWTMTDENGAAFGTGAFFHSVEPL
jgi:hypothetical protein